MEEIQGHTTEEGYTIKPPHIFTSSLRHFHCLAAASQKKKKKNPCLFWMLDSQWRLQHPTASHSDRTTSSSQSRPFLSLVGARTEAVGLVWGTCSHFIFCFTLVQSF